MNLTCLDLKKCSQRVLPAVVGSQTRWEKAALSKNRLNENYVGGKTTLSKNENYVDENEDRHDKSDHCGASERVEKEYISKNQWECTTVMISPQYRSLTGYILAQKFCAVNALGST